MNGIGWGRDPWIGIHTVWRSTLCPRRWSEGPELCHCWAAVCSWATSQASLSLCNGNNNTYSEADWSNTDNKAGKSLIQCLIHSKHSIHVYCHCLINVIIVSIIHKYWGWRQLICTGGTEGFEVFSFISRTMLWVHPRPSGGKREMCKEELHVGSSFASVRATSPLLSRCILLQSTLSPSSPTLLFFFSSTLLTSLFSSKPWVMGKELYYLLHVPSLPFWNLKVAS